MNKKTNAGFTLVEVVVTMVIVAILSMIAVPSYLEYIHKGRRADAKSALLNLQLAEEKFRANCPTYAGTIGAAFDCGKGILQGSSSSPDGNYTLSISAVSATTYQLTAKRQGKQVDDNCGDFTINQNGTKGVENATYNVSKCW